MLGLARMQMSGAEATAMLESLVRRLGGRAQSIERLTAREREVAAFVAVGLGNKQIADVLALAPRTVDAYLRGIFAKLEIDCRAAVAFLVGPTLVSARGDEATAPRSESGAAPAERARTARATASRAADRVARKPRGAHHGGGRR